MSAPWRPRKWRIHQDSHVCLTFDPSNSRVGRHSLKLIRTRDSVWAFVCLLLSITSPSSNLPSFSLSLEHRFAILFSLSVTFPPPRRTTPSSCPFRFGYLLFFFFFLFSLTNKSYSFFLDSVCIEFIRHVKLTFLWQMPLRFVLENILEFIRSLPSCCRYPSSCPHNRNCYFNYRQFPRWPAIINRSIDKIHRLIYNLSILSFRNRVTLTRKRECCVLDVRDLPKWCH